MAYQDRAPDLERSLFDTEIYPLESEGKWWLGPDELATLEQTLIDHGLVNESGTMAMRTAAAGLFRGATVHFANVMSNVAYTHLAYDDMSSRVYVSASTDMAPLLDAVYAVASAAGIPDNPKIIPPNCNGLAVKQGNVILLAPSDESSWNSLGEGERDYFIRTLGLGNVDAARREFMRQIRLRTLAQLVIGTLQDADLPDRTLHILNEAYAVSLVEHTDALSPNGVRPIRSDWEHRCLGLCQLVSQKLRGTKFPYGETGQLFTRIKGQDPLAEVLFGKLRSLPALHRQLVGAIEVLLAEELDRPTDNSDTV